MIFFPPWIRVCNMLSPPSLCVYAAPSPTTEHTRTYLFPYPICINKASVPHGCIMRINSAAFKGLSGSANASKKSLCDPANRALLLDSQQLISVPALPLSSVCFPTSKTCIIILPHSRDCFDANHCKGRMRHFKR